MEKLNKHLLVTWDFSPVSEIALEHAIRIAKSVDNEIRLVHIIDPDIQSDNRSELTTNLEEIIKITDKNHGIKLTYVILEGTIFNTIANYASDTEANMVIMGTHGIKGMQKVTGSWALKVIIGSTVPFLVVQDKPPVDKKFSDIVFPIDFRVENKEKLFWAIYLGKYFTSKIHLFKDPVHDKSLLKKVNTNLNFAVKFLIQNNIEYDIHTTKKSGKFAKETIKFAQKTNADLILIMTTKHINFSDYVLGASEQYIISNSAKIPVLCCNPKAHFAKVAQFMYG